MTVLEKAEQLKADLDGLRPLDRDAEARIMQKFRLDWNYHSNNLEGNSLTYGETKALILFGITAQGKPLKDHFEITGHNEAINWILEIVKGEMPLTEAFIRQLHTLLLKESSYKEALTPEGSRTRRKIEVGKYKSQPNHVITVTGETFYFATPEETPAKMHDLLEWFRKEKEKPNTNPIILAALFHYRFIRIHPFDDGNGRVARILMNFILMQFGYPPVIIKTEDKKNYYAVLRLADADQLEPFIEYIGENLVRSLEIMIRGAKGESIEEPDDLDKELALLEGRLKRYGNKIVKKNQDVLTQLYEESIEPLLLKIVELNGKFEKFYIENNLIIGISYEDKPLKKPPTHISAGSIQRDARTKQNTVKRVKSVAELKNLMVDFSKRNFTILITQKYKSINRFKLSDSEYQSAVNVKFEELKYEILESNSEVINYFTSKKYSEEVSKIEVQKILKEIANAHKKFLGDKISESED